MGWRIRKIIGRILLALAFFSIASPSTAQERFGVGLSGIYNFQTEGIGAGARVEFGFGGRLSIVPQVMYFPTINQVHEVMGALNLHYGVWYPGAFKFYLLAGGSADYWFNYTESHWDKARLWSFIAEAGGGMAIRIRSFSPFLEGRYNPIYKETSVHVGLMFYPGSRGSNGNKPKPRRRNQGDCPAYY